MFNMRHNIFNTIDTIIGIIISIILTLTEAPEIVLNVMPVNSRLRAGFR